MPRMADKIYDFLNLLKGVRPNGSSGWTALCPVHGDNQNSLAVSRGDDGRILVNCFAGCEAKEIVAAVGWELKDLFADSSSGNGRALRQDSKSKVSSTGPHPTGPAITVADLAADKGIPLDFLSFYTEQLPFGVKITYKNMDGKPAARQRLRIALAAKEGSKWTRGAGSPIVYGVWRVGRMSQESDTLLLVEGESDAWTAWYHKIAALACREPIWRERLRRAALIRLQKFYLAGAGWWRENFC